MDCFVYRQATSNDEDKRGITQRFDSIGGRGRYNKFRCQKQGDRNINRAEDGNR